MPDKIWGVTTPLVVSPMFELHRLEILPGTRCSFHVHRYKWNTFYVLSGVLYLDMMSAEHEPLKTVPVGPHGFLSIAPGVHHQFRTEKSRLPVHALEMYYTEPLSEDIIRHNVGGLVE